MRRDGRAQPPETSRGLPHRWRCRLVRPLAVAAVTFCARPGSAQELTGVTLTVTTSADAADCPDRSAILSAVAAQGSDRSPAAAPTDLAVSFGRSGDRYVAEITVSGPRGGQRRLEAPGPTCEGVAASVTVSVAVILDAHGRGETIGADPETGSAEPEAAPAPPPPTNGPTAAAAPPPKPSPTPRRPPPSGGSRPVFERLRLGAGVAVGLGLPRAVAPAATVRLEAQSRRWSAAVDGFWTPTATVPLSPGAVDVSLRGGGAEACANLAPAGARLRIGPCGGVTLGWLEGIGRGFAPNRSSGVPWLAPSVGLELEWTVHPRLSWAATGRGLVVATPHRFVVEGVGTAYETPTVAALVGSALRVRIW